jgi:hypothetical protein
MRFFAAVLYPEVRAFYPVFPPFRLKLTPFVCYDFEIEKNNAISFG